MKFKLENIILIVLVIALSIYLFLQNQNKTHYLLPKNQVISLPDITRIEISKQDRLIVLSKEDTVWNIAPNGYKADSKKIDKMLDAIGKLTLTALVSKSKNYKLYDLDEGKKIIIKAWAKEKLVREFDIGKAATSHQHTFVKLANDDMVYQAGDNLNSTFDYTVENLRDKIVFSVDQNKINKIIITKDQSSIEFERKEKICEGKGETSMKKEALSSRPEMKTVWQSLGGEKVDEVRLNRMLSSLTELYCEKYFDNRSKKDFKNPIYNIKLKGLKEYSLSIFAKTDEKINIYPAVSSENAYPFLIPNYKVDNIMVTPEELFEKADNRSRNGEIKN